MAFAPPNFNLLCNVYDNNFVPGLTAPRIPNLRCNMAMGHRAAAPASGGTGSLGIVFCSQHLLCPKRTDIRDQFCTSMADYVEFPSGSQQYYFVSTVYDVGRDFPNEYRAAVLTFDLTNYPRPVPIP